MKTVLIRFPVERTRKGNLQLQEDAIAAFEEALRAYYQAHGIIPHNAPVEADSEADPILR